MVPQSYHTVTHTLVMKFTKRLVRLMIWSWDCSAHLSILGRQVIGVLNCKLPLAKAFIVMAGAEDYDKNNITVPGPVLHSPAAVDNHKGKYNMDDCKFASIFKC